MKLIKVAVAAVLAFVASSAYAFHSGGVAECDGCHTMHNSSEGFENEHQAKPKMTVNNLPVGQTNPYLLQGVDQSSTCLVCHSHDPVGSYHILSLPAAAKATDDTTQATVTGDEFNYTPGGDFAWLKFNTDYILRGELVPNPGERKGHNVIAADFDLAIDSRPAAPGLGTYNGAGFNCISCHDPHGRYRLTAAGSAVHTTTGLAIRGSGSYGGAGNTSFYEPAATYTVGAYRILGGNGYQPKSLTGPLFTKDPPIALAPSSYNASESQYNSTTGVGQVQVAYGVGMSEWCSNCHPAMHGGASGTALTKHPSGATATLGSTIAGIYNAYIASGNTSGGADQYDSIVPFEVGTANRTTLQPLANNGNRGPDAGPNALSYVANPAAASSQVMCLSCHRAHASAFESIMRWNMETNEFLTAGSTWRQEKGDNGTYGRTANMHKAGMYMRSSTQYGSFQRSYCNKCHGKD